MSGLIPAGTSIYMTSQGDSATGGKGSGTILHTVNVTKATAAAVLLIYNGTSTNGSIVANIDCSALNSFYFDILCPSGVYAILTGAAASVTLSVA